MTLGHTRDPFHVITTYFSCPRYHHIANYSILTTKKKSCYNSLVLYPGVSHYAIMRKVKILPVFNKQFMVKKKNVYKLISHLCVNTDQNSTDQTCTKPMCVNKMFS